jgi:8-oxo-dGTP diphosphatase
LADSTQLLSHGVAAAVLRVRERLEVLLGGGRLPAADLRPAESLEQALARAVDLGSLAHLEQLETLAGPDGVVTAYLGLVPADAGVDGDWTAVDALPALDAGDASIVAAARARLRAKLSYTNVGFALAPSTFTISELRAIYVAALAHDVSATNLQRVLLRRGVLEQVEGRREPGRAGGRPAALFRFAARRLEVTDEFAALGPPR